MKIAQSPLGCPSSFSLPAAFCRQVLRERQELTLSTTQLLDALDRKMPLVGKSMRGGKTNAEKSAERNAMQVTLKAHNGDRAANIESIADRIDYLLTATPSNADRHVIRGYTEQLRIIADDIRDIQHAEPLRHHQNA